MLRKVAFAVVCAITMLGTSAWAGDSLKDTPRSQIRYNWTGLYVGGTVGVGSGSSTHCDGAGCNTGGLTTPPVVPLNDAVAGLTVGYNFQFHNLVAGIEADYSWSRMKGAVSSSPGFGCGGTLGCASEIDQFGTIRGRLGIAFSNVMPYITAGVAETHLKGAIGNPVLGSGSTWKTSAVFGGGVEAMAFGGLSFKVEYLHINDPGTFVYAPSVCGSPGCGIKNNAFDVMRIGVNHRF